MKVFSTRLGDNLLELGIGTGRLATFLIKKVRTVNGIDISEKMLGQARNNLHQKSLNLMVADASALPFCTSSLDCVICIRVLKYISAWEEVIKEVLRIVRKNGLFLFEISNLYSVAYLGLKKANYRLFSKKDVFQTLKKYEFKVIAVKSTSRFPFSLYKKANNTTFLDILKKLEGLMDMLFPKNFLSRSLLIVAEAQSD